jgi:hypothetical protein
MLTFSGGERRCAFRPLLGSVAILPSPLVPPLTNAKFREEKGNQSDNLCSEMRALKKGEEATWNEPSTATVYPKPVLAL